MVDKVLWGKMLIMGTAVHVEKNDRYWRCVFESMHTQVRMCVRMRALSMSSEFYLEAKFSKIHRIYF